MESTWPHLHPVPDAAIPARAPLTSPHTAAPPRTVLLWDPHPDRLQIVSRLIAACGARPCGLPAAATLPHTGDACRCPLAVVALGGGSPPRPPWVAHTPRLPRHGGR